MNDKDFERELALCRKGDEQAIAGLIAREMPAIRAAAARSICPGLEFDDAVQEGIIALFSAIGTYDEGRGASFSTYAAACVQNGIISARRAAGRQKHAPLNQSVSMEEADGIPGPEQTPEQAAEANERFSRTMEGIATRLSTLERQVLLLFLDGASYSAIARRLQVPEKAVDNALQRVRAKLRS